MTFRLHVSFSITACATFFLFAAVMSDQSLAQNVPYGLPEAAFPAGVGVNTHFTTGGEKDLDMIAAAGIKFIRQDFFWYLIETIPGEYNWGPYDTLVQAWDQRGIRGLVTLNLNNAIYCPGGTRIGPTDSANIAAYARFAATAAARYRSSHCVWEFWNEPNGKNTWKPNASAAEYSVLALAAAKAIRAVDSNATIVGPAMAGIHLDWLDTLFSSGVLNYIDGITVHPYRDGPPPKLPETAGTDFRNIYALISKYAPPGKKIFIVSGEWGYSTTTITTGVPIQTQADYFARMNLYNQYSGVPLTIWYDWKNDGTDLTQLGQNRGLVTADLSPKPSYVAATLLTHQLAGYGIKGSYNTGNSSDVVLVLNNPAGSVKIAAWTQGGKRTVTFPLSALSLPDTAKTIWWVNGNAVIGTVGVDGNSFTDELGNTVKYYSAFPPTDLSVAVPVPPVPTLVSPSSSSTKVLRKPTLRWNSSVSIFAKQYRIQLSADSTTDSTGSFIGTKVVFDTTLADTSVQLGQTLDSTSTYYWHVCAINVGGASAYSPLNFFTTGIVVSLPSVPVAVSPAFLATEVQRKTVFKWTRSNFADGYQLQIAKDYQIYTKGDSLGTFYPDNLIFDVTVADTLFQMSAPLDSSYTYFWHVRGINASGFSAYSATSKFTTGLVASAVRESNDVPKSFALFQNYPNPFNPATVIRYDVPRTAQVTLVIYDMLGRVVARLVNARKTPGTYTVDFDGSGLTSGAYIVRMSAEGYVGSRKILIVK